MSAQGIQQKQKTNTPQQELMIVVDADGVVNIALDLCRSACFVVCIAEGAITLVHLATFWATYIWGIAFVVGCMTVSIVSGQHLASRDALANSTCCTHSSSIIQFFWMFQIVEIIGAGFMAVTAIVSAQWNEGTVRIFAYVGLAAAIVHAIVAGYGVHRGIQLKAAAATDPRFVFPPAVAVVQNDPYSQQPVEAIVIDPQAVHPQPNAPAPQYGNPSPQPQYGSPGYNYGYNYSNNPPPVNPNYGGQAQYNAVPPPLGYSHAPQPQPPADTQAIPPPLGA